MDNEKKIKKITPNKFTKGVNGEHKTEKNQLNMQIHPANMIKDD